MKVRDDAGRRIHKHKTRKIRWGNNLCRNLVCLKQKQEYLEYLECLEWTGPEAEVFDVSKQ